MTTATTPAPSPTVDNIVRCDKSASSSTSPAASTKFEDLLDQTTVDATNVSSVQANSPINTEATPTTVANQLGREADSHQSKTDDHAKDKRVSTTGDADAEFVTSCVVGPATNETTSDAPVPSIALPTNPASIASTFTTTSHGVSSAPTSKRNVVTSSMTNDATQSQKMTPTTSPSELIASGIANISAMTKTDTENRAVENGTNTSSQQASDAVSDKPHDAPYITVANPSKVAPHSPEQAPVVSDPTAPHHAAADLAGATATPVHHTDTSSQVLNTTKSDSAPTAQTSPNNVSSFGESISNAATTSVVTPTQGLTQSSAVVNNAHHLSTSIPGVASQLVQVISPLRQTASGSHSVTVALQPEGLGNVKATVVSSANQIVVRLNAETNEGAVAIRSALPELHNELVAASHHNTTVVVADDSSQNSSSFDRPTQQHTELTTPSSPRVIRSVASVTAETNLAIAKSSTSSLLDVRI